MVGQIRSYISYIGVDSDQSYLDRIRKMIDDVPSDTDKATLLLEYTNKVNQVNIMKRYMEERKPIVEEHIVTPEPEEDEPLVKVKTFEEEMEEKIKEYQEYQEKEEREEDESYLPDIYTNAYNLIRMYNEDLKLLNGLPVVQKVNKTMVINIARNFPRTIPNNNFNKIPSLPIIED